MACLAFSACCLVNASSNIDFPAALGSAIFGSIGAIGGAAVESTPVDFCFAPNAISIGREPTTENWLRKDSALALSSGVAFVLEIFAIFLTWSFFCFSVNVSIGRGTNDVGGTASARLAHGVCCFCCCFDGLVDVIGTVAPTNFGSISRP